MRLFLTIAASALLALPAGAADLDSAAKDIVGVWQLDFTAPDNVRRTPMVIVGRQHQELVAWYIEDDKPIAFKDVCLKDDAVVATIKPKKFEDQLTVTLEARLEKEDVCCGKAKYAFDGGDSGDWEFTGKRLRRSDFDEATQWELTFTTPDYERHDALVTIVPAGEKVYGWYSGKEVELPIMRVDIDGDRVAMFVTAKTREGSKVQVTFRGTVEGDSATGNAEYEIEGDSGSFPFSAKLKSR